VRFICGSQTIHRELEVAIARFLRKDDAILFSSCYDANGGVFEALIDENDAIVSDVLNHASLIDGIRLCKAQRYRYDGRDMNSLELCLKKTKQEGRRFTLIATDGVFSMDGHVADLVAICALAEKYSAVVLVDDSHATGHIGEGGRGTPTLRGVNEKVAIITSTLGKSLGGASGGFVAGHQEVVDILRQRARPYTFSNSLAPPIVAGSRRALSLVESSEVRRQTLQSHTARFRRGLTDIGLELIPGETPIIPIMLYDAKRARRLADELGRRGVYVTSFSYPVVPRDLARVRVQMSAALSEEDVGLALLAFSETSTAIGAP
jgi:glycine C-acetyltransferase